jgi:predicted extracellular nuclease
MLTAGLPIGAVAPATAAPDVVAFDMVGSASQNLVSYTNPWTDAFASAGDGFQKYQRFVSPSIPFAVLDDSLSIFPPDSLGIIKEGNTDIFFGATDTENSDNSGPVTATWEFDISGASNLELSIDMGAMGDFEAASDSFVWEYSIDGGPVQTAFASSVDEAGSYTYTMEGGATFTLNDPLLMNGTLVTNDLAPFSTLLAGAGSVLTLTLTTQTDGGSEAYAAQNIIIEGIIGGPGGQLSVTCGADIVLDAGIPAVVPVSATDADDIADWVGIEVVPTPSTGSIALADTITAPTVGGTATANVTIDSDVAVETYEVTVNATNTDGDTASCTLRVDVVGPVPIHVVQGSGDVSPLEGSTVIVDGIVVGDFQEYAGGPNDEPLGGFMIQEPDADTDDDPATSEGLFIYSNEAVAVGDFVEVKGVVSEFFGLTEISLPDYVSVISSENPAPTAAAPVLPMEIGDPTVDWEAIEGMSVAFSQPLYVTGLFPHGSFGEVQLSAIGAQNHPNQVAAQGSTAAADVHALNVASRVILDDGEDENESFPNSSWNPSVTPYLDPVEGTLRSGDVVESLAGVVHYSFNEYEVHPVNLADPTYPAGAVAFTRTDESARPDAPEVGGSLKVASFNVLNYFTTLGSRGADTPDEFERQAAKIVDALIKIDADVVGLMEIENNGTAIADLVDKLNAVAGAGTYAYIDTGIVGSDQIVVGFIYQPATVTPVGNFAVLDSSVSPAFLDTRNRPAVTQTFQENSTAERITLAVNHLKSKGSACDDQANPGDPLYGVAPYTSDPELADFAGNCNLTRTAAAQVLGQWLADDPTGTEAPHTMIIGDLNAYANEDPITALEGLGYTDLNELYAGGNSWADGGHTYVFDGELGSLDYAMANAATLQRVTGAAAWHINADEPFALDYNDYNPPANYSPDQWKASDHDPVIVGLDLAQPMIDKMAVRDALAALLPADDKNTTKQIEKAIDGIDASLNPDWWIDDQTITDKKVFDGERQAVVQLELVVAGGVPEAAAAQEAIDILVNADRQLARIAIIAATNAGGDPAKLAEAEFAMSEAAAYVAAGLYNEAINAYKNAWDLATKA